MRLDKLRQTMAERDLDTVLIAHPENIRYLSGFTGGEGFLVITPTEAVIATDFRYYEQVEREASAFRLAKITARFEDLFPELLEALGTRRLGFEARHVSYEQYQTWTGRVPDVEFVPTNDLVEVLRAVKDERELEAIRRAVAVGDQALAYIASAIRPGMTEKEVAWELEAYMRTHGAEQTAFTIIVAAGPNGAMPHAVASDRAIQPGEPIIMDFGARVDGYCSDLTRTFCLGEPQDEQYIAIWNTVLQAQQAALRAIRPGMTGREAHAVAQQVIAEAGHGERFGHGLGHGVGLQIHEKPRLSRLSEDILLPGMVITIEPGIYLPGWGGVRIEDMAVVREDGLEILTQAPKISAVS